MAKRDSKGSYRVFEPAMHERVVERLEPRRAAARSRARPARDPLPAGRAPRPAQRLRRGGAAPLDAPDAGTIPPLNFIPLAEETGQIVPIGRWVLQEACRQSVLLHEQFPRTPPLTMSVNLSVKQLQSESIVDDVRDALEAANPPSALVLEITETVMMADTDLRPAAARAEGARGPPGDGRLRDRLLVALLPEPLPGRHPQDGPALSSRPSTTNPVWRRRSSPSETASTSTWSPRGIELPSRSRRFAARLRARPGFPVRQADEPRGAGRVPRRQREAAGERGRMQHTRGARPPRRLLPINLLPAHRGLPSSGPDDRFLVGDGIFLIAMVWQAYELWNAPGRALAPRDRA